MSWEPRRWATYPSERLEVLVRGIEAAGHVVQKISNGKPIVSTLNDADLELAACAARPGGPLKPGVIPPFPGGLPETKKPRKKRKRRKKKAGDE